MEPTFCVEMQPATSVQYMPTKFPFWHLQVLYIRSYINISESQPKQRPVKYPTPVHPATAVQPPLTTRPTKQPWHTVLFEQTRQSGMKTEQGSHAYWLEVRKELAMHSLQAIVEMHTLQFEINLLQYQQLPQNKISSVMFLQIVQLVWDWHAMQLFK